MGRATLIIALFVRKRLKCCKRKRNPWNKFRNKKL